jgi:hypothetical protein
MGRGGVFPTPKTSQVPVPHTLAPSHSLTYCTLSKTDYNRGSGRPGGHQRAEHLLSLGPALRSTIRVRQSTASQHRVRKVHQERHIRHAL